jgi:hypothetical protein
MPTGDSSTKKQQRPIPLQKRLAIRKGRKPAVYGRRGGHKSPVIYKPESRSLSLVS